MASRAWDRWHRGGLLAEETRYGLGGEAGGQALRANAGPWGLGTAHGRKDPVRWSGSVDTGRAITGGQTALCGWLAVCVTGRAGNAAETGKPHHTADLRSD